MVFGIRLAVRRSAADTVRCSALFWRTRIDIRHFLVYAGVWTASHTHLGLSGAVPWVISVPAMSVATAAGSRLRGQ